MMGVVGRWCGGDETYAGDVDGGQIGDGVVVVVC